VTTNTTQQKSVIVIRVQPSTCPFSVILFQIHERWASLDAEAIPLLLNGVALGVYRVTVNRPLTAERRCHA
jgi:hypothetical protein